MNKSNSHADRVVVVVFDGLRPDMATPELTPNILRVASRGAWFRNARSVFPSVTRVATSAIATGATPAVHGVVGNAFYFPQAMPDAILDTGKAEHIFAAHAATQGGFVDATTFADVLAQHGKRMCVVHAGSAGSAYCINPRAAAHAHWTFNVNGANQTQTPHAVEEAVQKLGKPPAYELPKLAAQTYCARVMTEFVLPTKPEVALVWFSEPDTSYHYLEIGSDGAKAALANADRALGSILDHIDAQPDADRVAVIIASDHGQISTSAAIPLFDEARAAGFPVAIDDLSRGRIVAAGGSSGEFRFAANDKAQAEYVAQWLMDHESVSHVFSRGAGNGQGEIKGTLPLDIVGQGHARSGDLMFILKSDLSRDKYGLPGMGLLMPGDVAPGGGYHGGLNPHELNTTLVVAGGGLNAGILAPEACGIIDIAPTILDLLGLPAAPSMQGRSLLKALDAEPTFAILDAGHGGFSQQVRVASVGSSRYIQDGGQK